MDIYLGVASFVYTLQKLGKEFSSSHDHYIIIWLPNAKSFPLLISAVDRESSDCGYIHTNRGVLGEMFNRDDFDIITETCVRDFNNATNAIKHCSSGDKISRTNVNGKEFYCRFHS